MQVFHQPNWNRGWSWARGVAALVTLLLPIVSLLPARPLDADDRPLHQQIDALVGARMQGPAAERTTDAEFLRRVTLDLAGRVPTSDEARAFLADSTADKRARRIDQLLASPDYPVRMADALHVMLMERLGEQPDWARYLHQAAAANKPWDVLVRELLYADPQDEQARGSAFFLSKRLENYGQNPVDYPALVRDVGRLFLGLDVQCAQCHDHLFVKQYTQDYFQGLLGFLAQTYLRTDVKFPAVAEKLMDKKLQFTSVFVQEPREIGPRLPGGAEVAIPTFGKGEEWEAPPDRPTNFPGVPKFSPLKILSQQLPRSETQGFAGNAANRFWWLMLGRGLVHPLDLHHADNPASHPELLELLANQFAAHKFDIKWLLRELALSDTYQRSSRAPAGVDPNDVPLDSYRLAIEKPLSSEQLLASTLVVVGLWPKYQAAARGWAGPQPAAPSAEVAEFTKLRQHFAKALANPPREPEVEFSPSVRAALFLANDATVLGWLQPADQNLVARLAAAKAPDELADELYLSVLTRLPAADERAEVADQLANAGEQRMLILGRLVWALLNSPEFALNH